jgi:hypothetical protein
VLGRVLINLVCPCRHGDVRFALDIVEKLGCCGS